MPIDVTKTIRRDKLDDIAKMLYGNTGPAVSEIPAPELEQTVRAIVNGDRNTFVKDSIKGPEKPNSIARVAERAVPVSKQDEIVNTVFNKGGSEAKKEVAEFERPSRDMAKNVSAIVGGGKNTYVADAARKSEQPSVLTPAATAASNAVPVSKQKEIIQSIFGPEPPSDTSVTTKKTPSEEKKDVLDNTWKGYLNERKKAIEENRDSAARQARYRSFGNLLTSMVQPIGWAVGGSTAKVQPTDDRAYLESFSRALKESEDLRNIGVQDMEYKLKQAQMDYERELAREKEQRRYNQTSEAAEAKNQMELEKQKEIYRMRGELNEQQIAGRIAVAEANAKAKYKFYTGNLRIGESVRDNLLKRVNKAYASVLEDYMKKKNAGTVGITEPEDYDTFLKHFASKEGITISSSEDGGKKEDKKGEETEKKGGFQLSAQGGGKIGGFKQ